MKKNSLVISILSCILLISALCSCGGNGYETPKKLSGRYIGQDTEGSYADFDYLEFFSDGKYTSSHPNYEDDYSIDGNRIRLEGILVDSKIYYFRTKGDILELSHSEDFENPDVYKKD